jgi:hypothetical protein
MAFVATGASGQYHYLVEFTLDSTTLRYADEDLSIQTSSTSGAFYEGRLPQSGSLRRALGTFISPIETIQTFPVVVDNHDGNIATHIQNYSFANRTVRIWLGEGLSKSDYSEVVTGIVAHPNGIQWDEDTAQFTVVDARIRHRKALPTNLFTIGDYANAANGAISTPIPIVYGDWGPDVGGVGNGLAVPAACVDTTTPSFKVCDHALQSLDRVLKNAVSLNMTTQVANISLSLGTFELSGISHNATTDTISINGKGLETAGGTLIDNPSDVLKDLYLRIMDLTSTDLNVTAFDTLATNTVGEKVRRCIRVQESSETLLEGYLAEINTDMRYISGKYDPKYRTLEQESTRLDVRDTDIILEGGDDEKAEFRIVHDPDRFYANKIKSRYNFDPVSSQYMRSYEDSDTVAIANVTGTVERLMDLEWYYIQTDAENRISRELISFATEPIALEARLGNRAMLRELADQIDLTYSVYSDRTFQIRSMETDLGDMTTRVQAQDLFYADWGRWTDDVAPSWSTATADQKEEQGFWSDDSGYVDPPDADSLDVSLWY